MKTFPLTRRTEYLVLFVLLSGMALLYNFPQVFGLGPYSFHMWRQTDCLSLTQGYYDNGLDFFQPCMNNQIGDQGKAVAEFPLLYYVNAALWKCFGKSEMMYRMLNTLLSLMGVFFIFSIARRVLDSFLWAAWISLILFTSPLYVFYANNFLVNVPALSFLFMSWYYLLLFYEDGADRHLTFSVVGLTLSILLKITMLYAYLFVYIAFLLEVSGKGTYGKDGSLFKKPKLQGLLLSIPPVMLGLWTLFAFYYNHIHHTEEVFLMRILPLWEVDVKDWYLLVKKIIQLWAVDIWFSYIGLLLLMLMWLFLIRSLYKLPALLRLALVTFPLALMVYGILFFINFEAHDYYLLEFLPFMMLLLFSFFLYLKQHQIYFFEDARTKVVFGVILVAALLHCSARYRIRYRCKEDEWVQACKFLYSEEFYSYLDWFHWDYGTKLKAFEKCEPALRQLGISKEDQVLSIPDYSPNITLYMMGQKGYTSYKWRSDVDALVLTARQKGVKYLIVNDRHWFIDQVKKDYDSIGQLENILIYRLENTMH